MHDHRYYALSEGAARDVYAAEAGLFPCMPDLTADRPIEALDTWRALAPAGIEPVVLALEATDRQTDRGAVYYRVAMVARVVWSPCGEEPGKRTPNADASLDWRAPDYLAEAGARQ